MYYKDIDIEAVDDGSQIIMMRMKHGRDQRNVLNLAYLQVLNEVLRDVQNTYHPKVIILSGAGRVFSLGADLDEIRGMAYSDLIEFSIVGQELMLLIREIDPIVIAAINGMALGGGFELALACNMRWAHSRAVFGFPECLHGLIPAWGGTQMAKNLIPSALAHDLLFSGMKLGAQNALGAGIVSRVFEGKHFHQDVVAAAMNFTPIERGVLVGLKQILNDDLPLSDHLRVESNLFASVAINNLSV